MELGKSLEGSIYCSVRYSIDDSVWDILTNSVGYSVRGSIWLSTASSFIPLFNDLEDLK